MYTACLLETRINAFGIKCTLKICRNSEGHSEESHRHELINVNCTTVRVYMLVVITFYTDHTVRIMKMSILRCYLHNWYLKYKLKMMQQTYTYIHSRIYTYINRNTYIVAELRAERSCENTDINNWKIMVYATVQSVVYRCCFRCQRAIVSRRATSVCLHCKAPGQSPNQLVLSRSRYGLVLQVLGVSNYLLQRQTRCFCGLPY